MVANLFLFIVFELASGFCNSLGPFLAVRALYGVCMGVSCPHNQAVAVLTHRRDYLRQPPQLHWKTFLTKHVDSSLACSNKAMPSAICWRRSSSVHLFRPPRMAGEVSFGSALPRQYLSSHGVYIFRRPTTIK